MRVLWVAVLLVSATGLLSAAGQYAVDLCCFAAPNHMGLLNALALAGVHIGTLLVGPAIVVTVARRCFKSRIAVGLSAVAISIASLVAVWVGGAGYTYYVAPLVGYNH
jgi:hypothetical protein